MGSVLSRRKRTAALILLVLGGVPGAAYAQLCVGQASWTAGGVKVGGELQLGSGVTDILGSLAFGKERGFFAGLGGGIESGGGDTGFLLTGMLGTELKSPLAGRLELCPVAGVVLGFGHHDISYQDFLGGVSLGLPVGINSQSVAVVLTGAFQLGYEHISNNDTCEALGIDCTGDVFGVLDAGVGLIFNERISVVPQLRIPVGTPGSEVAFRVRVNLAVGKK